MWVGISSPGEGLLCIPYAYLEACVFGDGRVHTKKDVLTQSRVKISRLHSVGAGLTSAWDSPFPQKRQNRLSRVGLRATVPIG